MNESEAMNKELDQFGVWVKNPPHDDLPEDNMDIKEEGSFADLDTTLSTGELSNISGFANINETDDFFANEPTFSSEKTPEIEVPEIETPVTEEIPTDFEISDFSDSMNVEAPKTQETEEVNFDATNDVSLDDFISDSGSSTETVDVSSFGDGDVDLSSFMDSPSDGFGDGDIDLDSFFDMGSSSGPAQEEIEYDDPIDIDLTFDEAPAEFAEEDENQTEIEASAAEKTVAKTESEEPEPKMSSEISSGITEEIDISDFGIDENDTSSIGMVQDETEKKVAEKVDYEMTVETDDETSATEFAADKSEANGDDEESISLETDGKSSNAPNVNQDPSQTQYSPDFDLDSLMSNVEDMNGGVSNDLLEKKEEKPEEEPLMMFDDFTENKEETPQSIDNIAAKIPEEPSAEIPAEENVEETIIQESAEETVEETSEIEEPVFSEDSEESIQQETAPADDTVLADNTVLAEGFAVPPATDTVFDEASEPEVEETLIGEELAVDIDNELVETDTLFDEPVAEEITEEVSDNEQQTSFDGIDIQEPVEQEIEIELPVTEPAPSESMGITSAPDTSIAEESNDILKQIMGELTSLKSEISGLKNEFETIKSGAKKEEVSAEEPDNGFFGNMDDDDTIALSGDELSNILNNAAFDQSENEEQEPSEPTIIEEPVIEEPVEESVEEPVAAEEEIEEIQEQPKDDVAQVEIIQDNSITKPIDIFAEEDTEEPITDESLSFLGESPVNEEEPVIEESEIQEEPEDSVTEPVNGPAVVENNTDNSSISNTMKEEIKSVLSYMDQLLENLPEEKITEFAQSEQFELYKKLFTELGLA